MANIYIREGQLAEINLRDLQPVASDDYWNVTKNPWKINLRDLQHP